MKKILKKVLTPSIWRKLSRIKKGSYSYYLWMLPIKKNKVVFSSFVGMGVGDSGKYIVKSLLANSKYNVDIVWLIGNDVESDKVEGVRYVNLNSRKALIELATAKVWIDNTRKNIYPPKRKKQKYIQLWHGFGPKKIDKDAENKLDIEYIEVAKKDSEMMDYLLSPSETFSNQISKAMWFDGSLLEYGLPRNDILFINNVDDLKKKIINNMFDYNSKIVLYAPTFRKDLSTSAYKFDFYMLKKELEQKYGGNFEILIKFHPNIRFLGKEFAEKFPNIYDVSKHNDMSELLAISDVLISDYSSLVTDFILTKRPCFLYTPDLSDYLDDRGVYFELETITGEISLTEDDLMRSIRNFNQIDYEKNIDNFLQQHGCNQKNNNSDEIAKIIYSFMTF